jgi:hypothetical protein
MEKVTKGIENYQKVAKLTLGVVRSYLHQGNSLSAIDLIMPSTTAKIDIESKITPIEEEEEEEEIKSEEGLTFEDVYDETETIIDSMEEEQLLYHICKKVVPSEAEGYQSDDNESVEQAEEELKIALDIAHKYWKWLDADPEERDIMPKEYAFCEKEDLFDIAGTPITCKCNVCHGTCVTTKRCRRCWCETHGHRGYLYNECRVYAEKKDNCAVPTSSLTPISEKK